MLLAAPAFVRAQIGNRQRLRGSAVPDRGLRILIYVIFGWTALYSIVLYGSERFHLPLIPLFAVLAAATLERVRQFRES